MLLAYHMCTPLYAHESIDLALYHAALGVTRYRSRGQYREEARWAVGRLRTYDLRVHILAIHMQNYVIQSVVLEAVRFKQA